MTECVPTAKQLVVLAHDTPFKCRWPPVRFGWAAIAQLLPFQRSISVLYGPVMFLRVPTAKQNVALGHETPAKVEILPSVEFGLETIAQVLPFQRSMSVLAELVVFHFHVPTAKQLVAAGHDTPDSWLEVAPAGFGLATTDHL